MAHKLRMVSLPPEVDRKGHKAAKEVFGGDKNFSTYIQTLINADCKKRKIK